MPIWDFWNGAVTANLISWDPLKWDSQSAPSFQVFEKHSRRASCYSRKGGPECSKLLSVYGFLLAMKPSPGVYTKTAPNGTKTIFWDHKSIYRWTDEGPKTAQILHARRWGAVVGGDFELFLDPHQSVGKSICELKISFLYRWEPFWYTLLVMDS